MDPKKFEQAARQLEKAIDRLNVMYEKYFMGLEKLEPASYRRQLRQDLARLRESVGQNTGHRFRVSRLEDKFRTYENYWNRVLREMENGTYVRELKRLKRRLEREGIPPELIRNAKNRTELESALASFRDLMERQESNMPESSEMAPPVTKRTGGRRDTVNVPDVVVDRAYRAFLNARKRTGEPTEGITRDAFSRVLEGQITRAQKEKGWRKVGIKITVQNGRAVLKLLNKEEDDS